MLVVKVGRNAYEVQFRHNPLGTMDATVCEIIKASHHNKTAGVGTSNLHPLDYGLYNKFKGMEIALEAALKNAKFANPAKKLFWDAYREATRQAMKLVRLSKYRRAEIANGEYHLEMAKRCRQRDCKLGHDMHKRMFEEAAAED